MADNPHRIVIELNHSNGFNTRDDRHLAEIVQRRIAEIFEGHSLIDSIRIETDKESTI